LHPTVLPVSGPILDPGRVRPAAAAHDRVRELVRTVVRSEPLGGGPLTAAALAGTTPTGWYPACPRGKAAWIEQIKAARAQSGGAAWLEELWPAIEASGAARERLQRAAERGVVVTTGQQPGLFGGPVYTWSKAIGVLALADALEQTCGIPVAPLFWAATDDADFVEASTTWVAGPGGAEPITAMPIARLGTVLAAADLGDLRVPLARLVDAAGSAPYVAALDAVRAAYELRASSPEATADDADGPAAQHPHGVTAGGAFVALLRRILAPLGVSVMDASHAAVRRRAFPTLVRALERAESVATSLAQRTDDLAAAGFTPQVSNVPGLSLVFAWQSGGQASDGAAPMHEGPTKVRVPVARARELATQAKPGELSHNVLLRPIVERALVPSVAYLGGPSEIAYFAQTSAVATALELPPPLIVPRWSCTLIEPQSANLLARYGLTLEELRDPSGPEARVARAALPAPLRDALDALTQAVEAASRAVATADTGELIPHTAVEGARAHLRHRVSRLERRYIAAAKQVEQSAMRDLATLRGALYPTGARQERILNFIPFLARGGPALLESMRGEAARHAAALVGGDSSRLT
jgi:uncharacterized protein YllA (UPF0747 family)